MTIDDTVQVDQGHRKTVKNPTSQSTSENDTNKEQKEPTTSPYFLRSRRNAKEFDVRVELN